MQGKEIPEIYRNLSGDCQVLILKKDQAVWRREVEKIMKKKWFAAAAAVMVLTVMTAGCSLKGGITDEGGAEPQKEREGRRRVDPEEFTAEESLWVDLISYDEETEKREDISLWLYPGEGEADIDGEKYELSDDQCNELREFILEYSLIVKEQEDEYWPKTDEYPDMIILFDLRIRGEEKEYRADGGLCHPDGWKEFIEDLKEIVCANGSGQKTAGPEKSTVSPETGPLKDKTAALKQVSPAEFAEDDIHFFSLLSYYEDTEEIEGITLFLYPGEEEARIVNSEEDYLDEIRLNEEQSDALKQLILEYSRIVQEQEDEYWPSDTEEASVMTMIFDFRMAGEEKEYRADGGLCYPDGWEGFIEDIKKIIS